MSGTSGGGWDTGRDDIVQWLLAMNTERTVKYTTGLGGVGGLWGGLSGGAGTFRGMGFTATFAVEAIVGNLAYYSIKLEMGATTLGYIQWTWTLPASPAGGDTATETIDLSLSLSLPTRESKAIVGGSDSGRALPDDDLSYSQLIRVFGPYFWVFQVIGSSSGTHTISGSGTVAMGDVYWSGASFGTAFEHAIGSGASDGSSSSTNITSSSVAVLGVTHNLDLTASGTATVSPNGTASVSGGAGNLSTSTTSTATYAMSSSVDYNTQVPTDARFDVLVTKMFDGYGGDVKLTTDAAIAPGGAITAGGGAYSSSQTWVQRNCAWDVNGSSYDAGIGTVRIPPTWFSFGFDSTWAAGEQIPGVDQFILLNDDENGYWAATTVTHATSISVDAFGSIAGWTGTNATVALSGGLRITATANGASAVKADYATDFRNYSKLRLNLACSSARTITVTIGAKTYSINVTAGAAADYTIDLCAPTNPGSATDATDSSWQTPGPFYGVQAVTSIRFGGLSNGDVLTVAAMTLVQGGGDGTIPGTVLACQAPGATIDDWYVTGSDGYRRCRLLWDYTDGKVGGVGSGKLGLDLPHAVRTDGTSGNSIQGSERLSLTELIALGNARPSQLGVTMTAAGTGTPAAYYNGALYAAYLADTQMDLLGARVNVSDADFSAGGALYAWPSYARISIYPGMTNPGSRGGSVFPVRGTKRLYGGVHGLVVDTSAHGRAATKTVTVVSGGSPDENDSTDVNGSYRSMPRQIATATITQGSNSLVRPLTGRYRRWAGFGSVADTGNYLAYDVSEAGRHYRAYVSVAGHLVVGSAPNVLALSWTDTDTGIAGAVPCIGVERQSSRQRIWLSYIDAGTCKLTYSDDEGATWGAAVIIASSVKHQRFCLTRHGTMHFFWVTGAAVHGLVMDGAGNTIVAEFVAVAASVDDDAIDCREFQGAQGEHRIGLGYRSGGNLNFVSATDAVTFS